ncbi:MAG TPA: CYTH domain-containing protein [Xanthobacteraceae bacterium]|nr:CYTH domain-containing protein [Xanthobacteraceae bacterium]
MGVEIERKFLVTDDGWQKLVVERAHIRQAYLALGGKATIRVRIKDDRAARLTIKSRAAKLRRLELEYPIPVADAQALIALRRGAVIEKVRHIVPYGGATWEIDVFAGENAGLIIAEIELPHEDARLELPPFIGAEVTGRAEYYNSSLVVRPYRTWAAHAAAP